MSVYGKGINDMYKGWRLENEWNKRVYKKWQSMLERCYSEKYHEKQPTYKKCSVCERWLSLSNFVEDFKLIDGYDETKFLNGKLELDKDIKTNGANKIYSLDNCVFISKTENVKQANKTRDYTQFQGEKHPLSIRIAQYDKQGNLIKIWDGGSYEIKRELGIDQSHIITCCKFWGTNCNKEEWYKTHKMHPLKSCGGFVWKYYKED